MKKKLMVLLAVCALAAAVTACGSKNNNETTAAATTASAEETEKETAKEENAGSEAAADAEEETKETMDAELEAQGPGAAEEQEAIEQNQNFTDLENSDYTGFANQIVEAVKAKDMNALADLMAYPTYISCVQENDGVVESKEAFLALDPEMIFNAELVDAISAADLSDLVPLMAGVVIGDDTPNIIFNSVDGELGIVGINY